MKTDDVRKERPKKRRSPFFDKNKVGSTKEKRGKEGGFRLKMHPLFFLVGVFYACTGNFFLFLVSTLVALQHELAHAIVASKLGYRLNAVVLMPFGAVIDGEIDGISFKDEISVAIAGPLCNLCTCALFVAIWWLAPTLYAFTDTACYASLAIALVNLLPAYPLDGGRILRCALARLFAKNQPQEGKAEKKASLICRIFTLVFSFLMLAVFLLQCIKGAPNFTLLAFGVFLCVGAFGNRDKTGIYERVDFSYKKNFAKGVEIKRIALLDSCPVKDTLRFLTRGGYLIVEIYDERENHLRDLSQNELSALFLRAKSPYTPLKELI